MSSGTIALPATIGRYTVTDKSLRAPRRAFVLTRIERASLRRPFFVGAIGLSAASYGFFWVFSDLLYLHEVLILTLTPAVLVPLSAQIAVLAIAYHGPDEGGHVIGRSDHLRQIRDLIDGAVEAQRSTETVL